MKIPKKSSPPGVEKYKVEINENTKKSSPLSVEKYNVEVNENTKKLSPPEIYKQNIIDQALFRKTRVFDVLSNSGALVGAD